MIGNSSAGVREMPFYGLPSINIGNRQNNRAKANSIINIQEEKVAIINAIESALVRSCTVEKEFGSGNSAELFIQEINNEYIWRTSCQKNFVDN